MKEQEIERLNFLIRRPFQGALKDLSILEHAIEEFPYFQPLRMLHLKIVYKSEKDFSESLKTAALYSADRSLLFNYITCGDVQRVSQTESLKTQKPTARIENVLKERYAFDQWVSLPDRFTTEESCFDRKKKKFKTIERFLNNYTAGALNQKEKASNLIVSSKLYWANENDLMTETLAQLYVNQKKYNKALKAYKILTLKYPEKSSFFAEKIHLIKEDSLDKK